MEEQIYKIIRIDEDDFGCEGRPEGQEPMVRVVLEADTGETMIVMMEDALMYTRKLDVGGLAIVGADGLLYAPGAVMSMEEVLEVPVDFEKQAAWMENYWDAVVAEKDIKQMNILLLQIVLRSFSLEPLYYG
jgi:hypothetical protein